MELTKEQTMMLNEIWNELKYRLIEFARHTRSKDVTIVSSVNNIKSDMLKLFSNYTEQEDNIALEFITFVIDSVIATTSLSKTIEKVDTVYHLSNF